MSSILCSQLSRRRLLRVGMIAVAGALAGCGDTGEPTKVESPPVEKGNRSRLQNLEKKAAAAAAAKK